jgi:hypothetical protein
MTTATHRGIGEVELFRAVRAGWPGPAIVQVDFLAIKGSVANGASILSLFIGSCGHCASPPRDVFVFTSETYAKPETPVPVALITGRAAD